ncbi:MAG: fibronectin type III domain-containing protein [Anaerolineae bacterium]
MLRRWWGWLLVLLLLPLSVTAGESEAGPFIHDVRVSNVRDVYVTVSWVTEGYAHGEVHYGTTPALGQVASDDRGATYMGRTHYVGLTGLSPATTYYFDVVSDGAVDDNGGAHYQVTTGPTLSPPTSDAVWGLVYQEDGTTPAAGAIVYLQVRDANGSGSPGGSAYLSALVSEAGYWFANLANARTADLGAYFAYSPSGDQVVLEAEGGRMGRATLTVDTGADSPAPSLRLVRPPARPLSLPLVTSDWRSR